MMDLLLWIEDSQVGIFIRESLWGYPIVLSSHAVGMATVMGVAVALNLRVLGFANKLSIVAFEKIFIIGWVGFIINLLSGLILFCGSSSRYFFQGSFQLKMGFILVGGVLMKVIMNRVRAGQDETTTKILAAISLASWFGGVITGRLMAYL
jgi:hypothetical protein